ncbi:MAG: hypothetical protein J6D31_01335 [Clostridia bacterium]|nr:hypothetical protein [Clostridia bacterium]
MMTLTENAAYLKGLAEGLNVDESKPEGKLITKMLALISDMADSISDLEDECEELRGYIEEIDDDLAAVEDDLYEDEDEEDDFDDEDEDEEETDFYEVTCPSCGEAVCFDDSLDPENLICPSCGEKFDCTCDGECEACDGCDCEE